MKIKFLTCMLFLLFLFFKADGQNAGNKTALTGVHIIDANHRTISGAQTVLIDGARISDVFATGSKNIPPGYTTLALAGKFLLPGLIDTHVHMATDPSGVDNRAHTLKVLQQMLLSGVTSVRDMAGDARTLASLARDAKMGDIQSPDIYYSALMAGPAFFDDPRTGTSTIGGVAGKMPYMLAVTDSTDLVKAVANAKGTGATGIKLYALLAPSLVARITEEADRQGMIVWGHAWLNPSNPSDLIHAGVSSISHAPLLIHEAMERVPTSWRERHSDKFWNDSTPDLSKLFAEMKNQGSILDATLLTYQLWGKSDSTMVYEHEIGKRFTAQAYKAGVMISTGTDDDQEFFVQEEIKLLVSDAGFTPIDAIIAATLNGAKVLHLEKTLGTVSPGKIADLLLLDKNPLESIGNIDAVSAVIRHGVKVGGGIGSNIQNNLPVHVILIQPGEQWYGGNVVDGSMMPFRAGYAFNMHGNVKGNQASPLLLSTQGRYIWSDLPFAFEVTDSSINSNSSLTIVNAGTSLRDAFIAAGKRSFPPSGSTPDTLLFTQPQYNTWIELVYNQNQSDILRYAHAIIDNGFPPGVLMIDDNWAPYYGKFDFRKDRFSDAKKMIDELHGLGFKIMIWVCPFISPDSEVFRELRKNKLLLLDPKGDTSLSWSSVGEPAMEPAIINWWNGNSAVMDFTNPASIDWYSAQLEHLSVEYGLDGFKFDAGDPEYYPAGMVSFRPATSNEHTELWGSFGPKYPLNEYRAMWKRGGQPIAERLRDKPHTWEALQELVPDITTSGLLGYAFACPDMIGGGEYGSFIRKDKLDQDLVVRSAQVHALMPMMQFSVAPWRVLDSIHLSAVKDAVKLRAQFVPVILQLAREAARNGEPIVRKMEYVFPHQGFGASNDQFMLGNLILVAPMTMKGNSRKVMFPAGTWIGDDGVKVKGPVTKEIAVPIDRLPWFRWMGKAK